MEPEPKRCQHVVTGAPNPDLSIVGWQQAAGADASVWAVEYTYAAIFDPMEQRQIYGTTGSRMLVRFFDAEGKVGDVGSTVDVANATWTDTIGAPDLTGVWTDPEFDRAERAVHYARVIEIPTRRWTAYEALRFGFEMPPDVQMTTAQRANTAPIWYMAAR